MTTIPQFYMCYPWRMTAVCVLASAYTTYWLPLARLEDELPGWGFSLRKGVPKVGAHMLCFSRASLVPFPTMAATVDPFGRLAFDTLLHGMWSRGLVWSPASALAFQVRHELKGRQ